MQKIKFDFEATKERIYAPNSNVPIGAPVDRNGNIANDGNAYGIVLCKETENEKYWVRYNPVVMVAGYCDIIDAQAIWGDEYSAEAIAAMSDIVFCDDHKIGGGGGWPSDLPKPSVGGYGYTERGEQTVITWDGDIEGRESVTVSGTMYKVSNKIITQSDVIGGEFGISNGITNTITEGQIIDFTSGGIENAFGIAFAVDTPSIVAMCVQNDTVFGDTPISAGVYFQYADAYTSSLTYGTPDTIHKIDEKYLPASGGGVTLVEFQLDVSGGQPTIICDKTPEEVIALSAESPVCGVLKSEDDGEVFKQSLGVFMHIITTIGEGDFYRQCFGFVPFIGGVRNGTFVVGINNDGEWEFNAM